MFPHNMLADNETEMVINQDNSSTVSNGQQPLVTTARQHSVKVVHPTRITGTVHTSAEARLTSVEMRIRIRIRDPDRHQFNHWFIGPFPIIFLKITWKFVRKFLRKVDNRQTDRQTDKQRRKHNLFDGGKYHSIIHQVA